MSQDLFPRIKQREHLRRNHVVSVIFAVLFHMFPQNHDSPPWLWSPSSGFRCSVWGSLHWRHWYCQNILQGLTRKHCEHGRTARVNPLVHRPSQWLLERCIDRSNLVAHASHNLRCSVRVVFLKLRPLSSVAICPALQVEVVVGLFAATLAVGDLRRSLAAGHREESIQAWGSSTRHRQKTQLLSHQNFHDSWSRDSCCPSGHPNSNGITFSITSGEVDPLAFRYAIREAKATSCW